MRQLLLTLALGASTVLNAQKWETTAPDEAKALLVKFGEEHRKTNYKLTFNSTFYGDLNDSIPVSKSNGRFVRGTGNCYRSDQTGELVIQTDAVRMVVDSNSRLVVVTKPDTLFKVIDVQSYTSSIKWEQYTCRRMVTSKDTRYELVPGNPAEVTLQLWADKKTGTLTHIEILFPRGNYTSEDMNDSSQETPRMVINYSPPAAYSRPAEFDLSPWIVPAGASFKLNASLPKDYRLEDLRTPSKH